MKIDIDIPTIISFKNVMEYMYRMEEKDWYENDCPNDHIFIDLKKLSVLYDYLDNRKDLTKHEWW